VLAFESCGTTRCLELTLELTRVSQSGLEVICTIPSFIRSTEITNEPDHSESWTIKYQRVQQLIARDSTPDPIISTKLTRLSRVSSLTVETSPPNQRSLITVTSTTNQHVSRSMMQKRSPRINPPKSKTTSQFSGSHLLWGGVHRSTRCTLPATLDVWLHRDHTQ